MVSEEVAIITLTVMTGGASWGAKFSMIIGAVEGVEVEESSDEDALQGDYEELEWEQCNIEHVQWDDFRMGSGKEWSEVTWIAFRHRLTRDELEEQFPDCGSEIKLDNTDDDDVKAQDEADQACQGRVRTRPTAR